MVFIGSTPGLGHPSVFVHKDRGVMCLVHGDAFFTFGALGDLKWLSGKSKERFKVKTPIASDPIMDSELHSEVKILNRMVLWVKGGFEYEADPRHAQLVIEQLGSGNLRGLTTQCIDWKVEDMEAGTEIGLGSGDAKLYRMVAALLNYLAMNRPDARFVVK